uniref:HMG-Y-related protein A n=1 Tax=Zea mays TaxID=4577 RepID=Q9S7Z7_MAIZE|nr:HMGI/Y protein [Zea mays]
MATDEATKPSPIPPYPEMILAAIEGLDEKSGSNKSAISKYIEGKYGSLPPAHESLLTAHLAAMKESGELVFLKNNYFRADAPPNAPPKRGRGRPPKARDPNAPAPAPKSPSSRGAGRPPKAKSPLEARREAGHRGMPKPRGRPPKKAKTEGAASPSPSPAPAGDGSTPGKRGRGRPPKVRPAVPSETAAA